MHKYIFWGGLLSVSIFFLYMVSNILAPFVISLIFAYLLQPIIDANTKRFKLSRNTVSTIVFMIFIGLLALASMLITPLIIKQVTIFIKKIPQYRDYLKLAIENATENLERFDSSAINKITESLHSAINSAFSILSSFANHIWEYTVATINAFTLMVLIPIIMYYFMRDWHLIVSTIRSLMPLDKKSKINEILRDINTLLAAYIRGQLNICLSLTVYYAIVLNLIGLDLALLLSLLSGFLIIIPFIGTIFSYGISALSCYLSFGFGYEFLYLNIAYIIGHTVEGYFLTPKIIGTRIGLHPVWVMFAVFAAGTTLGFVGVLLAIPIAGTIKVLVVHFIRYYKTTKYYKGERGLLENDS